MHDAIVEVHRADRKSNSGGGVPIEGGQEKVSGYVNGKFIFCTEVHSLNPLCQHPSHSPDLK